MYISGFADEIDKSVDIQFAVLNKLGIKYFEPREIDGKDISLLSLDEAKDLKNKMDKAGIKASAIGSPIGKTEISDADRDFELFKHIVEIAKILDCRFIRIFSYYNACNAKDAVVTANLYNSIEVIEALDADGQKAINTKISQLVFKIPKNDAALLANLKAYSTFSITLIE